MGYLYLSKPFGRSACLRYAAARVGRVVPLYLVGVAAVHTQIYLHEQTAAVPEPMFLGAAFSLRSVLESFLFVRNSGWWLWSVPVEVQFYIVFPAIWWLASSGHLARVGTALALVSAFVGLSDLFDWRESPWYVRQLVSPGHCNPTPDGYLCVVGYMPVFTLGSLLGASWRSTLEPLVRASPRIANAATAAALTYLLCPMGVIEDALGPDGAGRYYYSNIRRPFCWLVSAVLIIGAAGGVRCTAFLEQRLLLRLGDVSFGLYVYHGIVLSWTFHYKWWRISESQGARSGLPLSVWVVFASLLGLSLSILLALASFHLFERRANVAIKQLAAAKTASTRAQLV